MILLIFCLVFVKERLLLSVVQQQRRQLGPRTPGPSQVNTIKTLLSGKMKKGPNFIF